MIKRLLIVLILMSSLYSIGYSQDSTQACRGIVLGYAIQDNDDPEYKFSESFEIDKNYSRKEIYFRFADQPNEWHYPGFWANRMKASFKVDEAAFKEFQKYRRRVFFGNVLVFGGVAAALPVALFVKNGALLIAAGELLVTGTGGTLLLKDAEKHLYHATELLNAKCQH